MTFSPVRLPGDDVDGQLLFAGETLVGVIARLSATHGDLEGFWHIEYTGIDGTPHMPVFRSLGDVSDWFSRRLPN